MYVHLGCLSKDESSWDPGCYVEMVFSSRLRDVKSREKVNVSPIYCLVHVDRAVIPLITNLSLSLL